MKKLIIVIMLVAFAFTVAYAADTVTYENKKGTVTFDHKTHGEKMDCAACFYGEPPKIDIEMVVAMVESFIGCKKKKSGPTKCNDCHKK
jgi:hypothetical protein